MFIDPEEVWLQRLRVRLLRYRVPNSLQLFCYLGLRHFGMALMVYYLLRLIMPHGWVFGALYRMPCYHWGFPAQYIALMVLVHTAITAVLFATKLDREPNIVSILVVMGISVFVASPLGGLLWVYHDMESGYYPTGELFSRNVSRALRDGVFVGWLIIVLSIPYNLIGIYVGSRSIKSTLRVFRCHPNTYLERMEEKGGDCRSLASLQRGLPTKNVD